MKVNESNRKGQKEMFGRRRPSWKRSNMRENEERQQVTIGEVKLKI